MTSIRSSIFKASNAKASFLLVLFCINTIIISFSSFAVANVRETLAQSNATNNEQQALNYLLFSSSNNNKQPHDSKLDELLKDSNHSHVSDAINLQLANSVWKRMRQNALEFAQKRAVLARPTINRLLDQANVSSTCRQSLNDVIDHIANLDQWAVQSKLLRF